jgi:hypothetical protein
MKNNPYTPQIKTRKKPGPKKYLNKDLFFFVDPSKIKYYSIGKKTTLIPLKKRRKNKTVKIVYCGSNGTGLLKSSKIEFSKAIRA